MKLKILMATLLSLGVQSSIAGNYILNIGNESYELSLGETTKVKVNGQNIPIKLIQKDSLIFKTENFSFEHPRQYNPSKTDLGDGVYQTTMMTPLGSLVLVQEYESIDPAQLIDFMKNELTKEEKEYGYKIESSPTSIKLPDGKVLTGKVVTSKYKGSDIKRNIVAYSAKDSGLLVVTHVDYESEPNADAVVLKVVDSLKVTMD